MVDANIHNSSETTIVAARSHDDHIRLFHLSHLIISFGKVDELAS